MRHNIFKNIPKNLQNEVFETLSQSRDIKIERIISKGQSTPKGEWYDQEKNEFVILLKGSAILEFENTVETSLQAGDYIDIQAHQKHRVKWTDPTQETIWLAIFYSKA